MSSNSQPPMVSPAFWRGVRNALLLELAGGFCIWVLYVLFR